MCSIYTYKAKWFGECENIACIYWAQICLGIMFTMNPGQRGKQWGNNKKGGETSQKSPKQMLALLVYTSTSSIIRRDLRLLLEPDTICLGKPESKGLNWETPSGRCD